MPRCGNLAAASRTHRTCVVQFSRTQTCPLTGWDVRSSSIARCTVDTSPPWFAALAGRPARQLPGDRSCACAPSPDTLQTATPSWRAPVSKPVHPIWRVIGLQCRRLDEIALERTNQSPTSRTYSPSPGQAEPPDAGPSHAHDHQAHAPHPACHSAADHPLVRPPVSGSRDSAAVYVEAVRNCDWRAVVRPSRHNHAPRNLANMEGSGAVPRRSLFLGRTTGSE